MSAARTIVRDGKGAVPRMRSTCSVMRALVAKLIRKCLREVKKDRGSSIFEREANHLSISVLSSPIFSRVNGMFTLA